MDVVNDGKNSSVDLARTAKTSGQSWKFTPIGGGFYRITSDWLGSERSLEVVKGGEQYQVRLGATANVTGQAWRLKPADDGCYRLTTRWLGEDFSLDVVNDNQRSTLTIAGSDEVAGQFWKLSLVSEGPLKTVVRPLKDFRSQQFSGFTVNIHPDLADHPVGREVLQKVEEDLNDMTKVLTAEQAAKLRKVPIWLQYRLADGSGLWYHASKDWLVENGYPAELEKSVEMGNVVDYLQARDEQPYGLFHEFAHAYHDLHLSHLQGALDKAFEKAVASGKYNKVKHVNGETVRAYALTGASEYFAEISEAYLGKNDFFPFTREDLAAFDAEGYKLMQAAWGRKAGR
ncbi:MAG: hypothetical protein QUS14_15105 [Pyrinomonadaceae bacterium]|nr:hypothetical protein [Pyrinomonadaceae bacterium]